MKNILYLMASLSVVFYTPYLFADNDWLKVKDNGGIEVYIMQTADSEIVKAKAVISVKSNIQSVDNLLNDIDYRHQWIPFLKQSKLISTINNKERLEYSHFSAPWPASDRDFVYQLELVDNTEKTQVYKMSSVISELMPETQSMIRADLFESVYTLRYIEEDVTQVELIFHADPKGWLPNWIINIIQQVLPYKILENLRSELEIKNVTGDIQ